MSVAQSIDGERLIAVFTAVVEQLGRALPRSYELVLHDLSKLPNSIVAISGEVTTRTVGDPATDLLLKQAATGNFESRLDYETGLADGRRLRSSTMIIEDVSGRPVAALCMNADVSVWEEFRSIAHQLVSMNASPGVATGIAAAEVEPANREHMEPGRGHETFVHDVDELATILIGAAIRNVGIPTTLMHKNHKVEVVRDLKARGLFLLKDAVQLIADELNVTRFTIYNYLNQIAEEEEPSGQEPATSEGTSHE
ncbi:helix-turn-helix transcriptional regulator [Leucobacter komagatae]|uniref:helix-turn-helix transcriptional regulator n=1 Tax=Leucobacter komagatae TaxID=55969 RepID=UPI0005ABD527|nr:PAS domain-containing protein [Leucobacter komagatae]